MESLARSIADAREGLLLVVTGAGVSLASGIPTFRGSDPDAVWSRDVTELASRRYFEEDPVGSWRWYIQRFDGLAASRPNAAHTALVELERWHLERGGSFLLVTQNIDGLHRRSGSENLVEVHGTCERVRCSRAGCELAAPAGTLPRRDVDLDRFLAAPGRATLPRCPRCDALIRPHILWFDEYYSEHEDYQYERVVVAAHTARVVLFAGTSFAVGATELVLDAALARGCPAFTIDPCGQTPRRGVKALALRAEEALPELVVRLRS